MASSQPLALLADCEAHAKAMCADAIPQGYDACHKCVWGHREDLIQEGCDFDGGHSAITKFVCGTPPGLLASSECVEVERDVDHELEASMRLAEVSR